MCLFVVGEQMGRTIKLFLILQQKEATVSGEDKERNAGKYRRDLAQARTELLGFLCEGSWLGERICA